MTTLEPTPRFAAQALSAAAFAPFGEVVAHAGTQRRHFLQDVFDGAASTAPQAWVSHLAQRVQLPLAVTTLERHRLSAQTFVPLTPTPYLVFVAGSHADGSPDLGRAQAFVAGPQQGVCIRRGTWHFGLSPLHDDAQFLVLMNRSTDPAAADDEFRPLTQPCEIVLP